MGTDNGWVMLKVFSELPITAHILGDQDKRIVSSFLDKNICVGTIVRPRLQFYIEIENLNSKSSEVKYQLVYIGQLL